MQTAGIAIDDGPDWLPAVVLGRREIATDIVEFEIGAGDGGALPAFSAGAHIDVEVGVGLVRQYSLIHHPGEPGRYLIAVQKADLSRGGSLAIHQAFVPGKRIRIGQPRNHFPLHRDTRRALLLAGGIGITPILSMVETLDGLGREFRLHYSVRSVDRLAYRDRLSHVAGSGVVLHCDDTSTRLNLDRAVFAHQPGDHLYVCGPAGFIAAVLEVARAVGWPEASLHRESFDVSTSGSETDSDFTVKIASTGQFVPVRREQTVLDALADAGIVVPRSCEQGVCGTCLVRVIEGRPDHRDVFLTDEEHALNDQFTPCCSRSMDDVLIIDL